MTDPGRTIGANGQIVYTWPPTGRYAELWQRIDSAAPDADKEAALGLLLVWSERNSTLVGYKTDDGGWQDIDWQEPTDMDVDDDDPLPSGEDPCHLYCCDPDLAYCGRYIGGELDLDPEGAWENICISCEHSRCQYCGWGVA